MDTLRNVLLSALPVITTLTFALTLLLSFTARVRGNLLRDLWKQGIQQGNIQRVTRQDLLRPWIVRLYQRSYIYYILSFIFLSIAASAFLQAIIQYTPITYVERIAALRGTHAILLLFTLSQMIRALLSTQLGLRAEVRALSKLIAYEVTLEDLMELHEEDHQFSIENVFPPAP